MTPHRLPPLLSIAALLLAGLPAQASSGAKELLRLETVLQNAAALQYRLPEVLWLPDSSTPTLLVTAADGSQTLHNFAEAAAGSEPIVTASTAWAALQLPVPKPARLPALAWLAPDRLRLQHDTGVAHWQLGDERAQPVLSWPKPDVEDRPLLAIAPGDQHALYVREHQLWLTDTQGRHRQLTTDGSPDIAYGTAAHRAEFGIDSGLFWSPDGSCFAFSREDLRGIDPYPYQDLRAMPPAPRHGRYPMAGRQHSRVRIGIGRAADASLCWLEADPDEDVYWAQLAFAPDRSVVIARISRRQEDVELVRYDSSTGKRLAVLLREHDPRWIEPQRPPHFLADGRFLWWSQRDGHRHLWLCGNDNEAWQQVTRGAFDVQELLGISPDQKSVIFAASGEDPRQRHLFAAPLDGGENGGEIRQLTRERGSHRGSLSPDGKLAQITYSNLETPPQRRLLDLATGTTTLLPAPADPLQGYELPVQRLFQLNTDDDTVLYGHLALPPGTTDEQRLPVLLYVYGGPHVQQVTDQWLGGAPLWLQAFAGEGYAVCRLDNRGTPNRGREFETAIHRQLGKLEVEDQLRAVAWLQQQPFVDPQRIGVHGWSYGGYMTLRLLLLAPDSFACGISGAPVTDWAMYETGYTERYMDLPAENPDGYAAASCLPLAGKLQRPLLLVHGTDDQTVMWSHSLRFVDRCIENGRTLDYLPYPMQRHGLVGKSRQHFLRLLRDWLARHLRPEER